MSNTPEIFYLTARRRETYFLLLLFLTVFSETFLTYLYTCYSFPVTAVAGGLYTSEPKKELTSYFFFSEIFQFDIWENNRWLQLKVIRYYYDIFTRFLRVSFIYYVIIIPSYIFIRFSRIDVAALGTIIR